jgi:carboxyl-terminal processing protease
VLLVGLVPIGLVSATTPDRLINEIDGIVRDHYYDPAQLKRVNWNAAVVRARGTLSRAPDWIAREDTINALLSTLKTSHTSYYHREDPAYWQMAGIFEPVIASDCTAETRPSLPVTVDDIGVFWKRIGSAWFVGGVYAGSPAEAAGFKVGDEVVSADGVPFSPVIAFSGKANTPISVDLRRRRDGDTTRLTVTPQAMKPHEALQRATEKSWHIIQQGSRRVAYLHVWSWTSIAIQQAVLQAITKSDQAAVDAFMVDLRDGWGGASPHYLTIFGRNAPILESIERDGSHSTYDAQIRKPAVILVNRATRSG